MAKQNQFYANFQYFERYSGRYFATVSSRIQVWYRNSVLRAGFGICSQNKTTSTTAKRGIYH